MRPEVDDLQHFYGTRQGQLARRLIHHQIKALWPDLTGCNVLGFGYAAPFLAGFDTAARTVALMPAEQGSVAGRRTVAGARPWRARTSCPWPTARSTACFWSTRSSAAATCPA